jgi:hypothetical protein
MAMRFAVPPGKIAMGVGFPARLPATSLTVPSPPYTATTSTPATTAWAANRAASPLPCVTETSQMMPAARKTEFRM